MLAAVHPRSNQGVVVVAVRYGEMTSLRAAAEITERILLLIVLLPMTALLPAQTAPWGTVSQ